MNSILLALIAIVSLSAFSLSEDWHQYVAYIGAAIVGYLAAELEDTKRKYGIKL